MVLSNHGVQRTMGRETGKADNNINTTRETGRRALQILGARSELLGRGEIRTDMKIEAGKGWEHWWGAHSSYGEQP